MSTFSCMECLTEPEARAFDTRTYAREYPYDVSRLDVRAGSGEAGTGLSLAETQRLDLSTSTDNAFGPGLGQAGHEALLPGPGSARRQDLLSHLLGAGSFQSSSAACPRSPRTGVGPCMPRGVRGGSPQGRRVELGGRDVAPTGDDQSVSPKRGEVTHVAPTRVSPWSRARLELLYLVTIRDTVRE